MGSYVRQLVHVITVLHLDNDPVVAGVLARMRTGRGTERQAKAYLIAWAPLINERIRNPNVLPPLPEEKLLYAYGRPDFEIGTLENGLRFGIRQLDRSRHGLLIGTTGSGKTHAMSVLLSQVHGHNLRNPDDAISCLAFNRKGLDLPLVAQACGWINTSIHHGLSLSLAPPEGVPPRVWINIVSELFSVRAGMIASAGCLSSVLAFGFAALNPNGTQILQAPSLQLCLDIAKKAPATAFGEKPEYIATLIHNLNTVLQASGDLLNGAVGLDLERDIIAPGRSICIDITNARPGFLRLFLVDLLIAQVLLRRLHVGDRKSRRVLIILDEADEDLSQGAESDWSRSPGMISLTLKQGREFRVAAFLGLSQLGNASRFVLSNATYQLFFTPADRASLYESSQTMLLPEGGQQMLRKMPVGRCIAVESLGSFPDPVMVNIDPLNLPESRIQYQQMPSVPGKPLSELPEVEQAVYRLMAAHGAAKARQKKADHEVSALGHDLLSLAAMHPFVPCARLWEKMDKTISAGQRQAVRNELEDASLATFTDMRLGKSNRLLIEVDDKGYELLNRPVAKRHGRGDSVHRHAAHWIAWLGRARGHDAAVEELIRGTSHHVDAAWSGPDGITAFEFCHQCFENAAGHALACFVEGSGVTSLVFVTLLKTDLERVRSVLDSNPRLDPFRDRFRFDTLESFAKELNL